MNNSVQENKRTFYNKGGEEVVIDFDTKFEFEGKLVPSFFIMEESKKEVKIGINRGPYSTSETYLKESPFPLSNTDKQFSMYKKYAKLFIGITEREGRFF